MAYVSDPIASKPSGEGVPLVPGEHPQGVLSKTFRMPGTRAEGNEKSQHIYLDECPEGLANGDMGSFRVERFTLHEDGTYDILITRSSHHQWAINQGEGSKGTGELAFLLLDAHRNHLDTVDHIKLNEIKPGVVIEELHIHWGMDGHPEQRTGTYDGSKFEQVVCVEWELGKCHWVPPH